MGMKEALTEIITSLSAPVQPDKTDITSSAAKYNGKIQAVFFDLYGTLMVSAAGDISTSSGALENNQADDIFIRAMKYSDPDNEDLSKLKQNRHQLKSFFFSAITDSHEKLKKKGFLSPEVDILEIWQTVFEKAGIVNININSLEKTAAAYEAMANKTWPMPEMENTLQKIRKAGLVMGIISNAQFYSGLLFDAYTGKTAEETGFSPDYCFWSYKYSISKPDLFLFKKAADTLEKEKGIPVSQILYTGNDMLNDIMPAKETGMVTALFAGDKKSLRLRENTAEVKNIKPDFIITELSQILKILDLHNGA